MNTDDHVIELKELRIGNLLDYKGELVQVTLLSRDIDDEYEDQICFVKYGTSTNETGGWNRSLVNDLKRIPITPEWLGRFGFVNNSEKKDGELWTNGELVIIYDDSDAPGISGDYRLIIGDMSIRIDNVHQLQNLYFALTGEELTIKETV